LHSSLALISGRATINSLEVLSMLVASYLYALCQGTIFIVIIRHLYLFSSPRQLWIYEPFRENSSQDSTRLSGKKSFSHLAPIYRRLNSTHSPRKCMSLCRIHSRTPAQWTLPNGCRKSRPPAQPSFWTSSQDVDAQNQRSAPSPPSVNVLLPEQRHFWINYDTLICRASAARHLLAPISRKPVQCMSSSA
jgi:hypothetical protein